jgi:hypothetical protein
LPNCRVAGNGWIPANRIAILPAITTKQSFAPVNCRIASSTQCHIAFLPYCQQSGNRSFGVKTNGELASRIPSGRCGDAAAAGVYPQEQIFGVYFVTK